MAAIIEIVGLSKQFPLGAARPQGDSLREILSQSLRSGRAKLRGIARNRSGLPGSSIWALRNVSFDISLGDVTGIIGANGAGKSTLLKILSRITDPTEGYVKLHGRVASLLEVGTGFHPDLTGRENIFLNGVMLGMTRAEIRSKFDEIVAFAELDKFVDTPVKHYSSGMYVRLGFAVAAHLQPEILVVDEVLAVGDMAFQKKCLGKMSEFSQQGRTVLFVSHNMAAIENLCTRGVVLDHGQLVFSGATADAIQFYIHNIASKAAGKSVHKVDLLTAPGRRVGCRSWLRGLQLFTKESQPVNGILPIGAPLKLRLQFRLENPTSDFDPRINFVNVFGQVVFAARSSFEPNRSWQERAGDQEFVCEIPSLTLTPGEYRIHIALVVGSTTVDYIEDALQLTITESDYYRTGRVPTLGSVVLEHHWYPA